MNIREMSSVMVGGYKARTSKATALMDKHMTALIVRIIGNDKSSCNYKVSGNRIRIHIII